MNHMTRDDVMNALEGMEPLAPVVVEVSDGQGEMRLRYVEKVDVLVVPMPALDHAQGFARLRTSELPF